MGCSMTRYRISAKVIERGYVGLIEVDDVATLIVGDGPEAEVFTHPVEATAAAGLAVSRLVREARCHAS